ncbi:hypothetical protein [Pseudomonas juntendi]
MQAASVVAAPVVVQDNSNAMLTGMMMGHILGSASASAPAVHNTTIVNNTTTNTRATAVAPRPAYMAPRPAYVAPRASYSAPRASYSYRTSSFSSFRSRR